MKFFIYFISIFQIGILNSFAAGKSFDAILFEHVKLGGIYSYIIYPYRHGFNFLFIGKYLKVNFGSKDCFDLPKIWTNRVSSIFTSRCIVLSTQSECKPDIFKVTLSKNKVYFDDNKSQNIYIISSSNFHKSR